MKAQDKKILCSLIRDHEDNVGSSRATMMALKAFIESIKAVKCEVDQVRDLYFKLAETIKNTEPKAIFNVTNMLKLAKEVLQKTFNVIVLKQDLAKTRRLIKSLSAVGIDMEIIPEYSLNHYIEQGNKAAIADCIQRIRNMRQL